MTLIDLLIVIGPYPAVSRMTTSPPGFVAPIAVLKPRQGSASEHGLESLPNEATNDRLRAPARPAQRTRSERQWKQPEASGTARTSDAWNPPLLACRDARNAGFRRSKILRWLRNAQAGLASAGRPMPESRADYAAGRCVGDYLGKTFAGVMYVTPPVESALSKSMLLSSDQTLPLPASTRLLL